MAHRTSTTRLPAVLREQIDQESGQVAKWHLNKVVHRKAARKQDRQEQKQRKALYYSHSKSTTGPSLKQKRSAYDGLESGERSKKRPRASEPPCHPSPKIASLSSTPGSGSSQRHDSVFKKRYTSNLSDTVRHLKSPNGKHMENIPKTSREDLMEDLRIAWLESKLGIVSSKGGHKKRVCFGDGLDDLLEDLDRIVPASVGSPEGQGETSLEGSEASVFEGFSDEEGECIKTVSGEQSGIDNEIVGNMAPNSPVLAEEGGDVASQPTTAVAQFETRYIPPHLRQHSADDTQVLEKLSRQVKGLLNRLGEQNLTSILTSIEQLYRTHRRIDITSTVTSLIIGGISSHSSLLDSFVVLHASLVASLHKIIGVDFAAHFVQHLIGSYEQSYHALRVSNTSAAIERETKGKECLNLVVLLSELYNFQVVSCLLLYDIIRSLLEHLDGFDVELLLKIVRNSGQRLRQDDPSALKEIIQLVQAKMNAKEQSTISSRTRFMIETITNLKNNKVKSTTGQDGHSESVTRMKKFVAALSRKHHIVAHEPLQIALDDVRSSEKKGKWWLVGSGWNGDPLLDRVPSTDPQTMERDVSGQVSDTLAKLARKQRMNTDVRRGIFVVVMSSEDYVDACDRLAQLDLTEIQQREIIRVVIHCLGNEKLYNPYYTLIIQHLCSTSHSYKVTLQFFLWDLLRNFGENDVGGAEIIMNAQDDGRFAPDVDKISSTKYLNIARAYAWWLAKGCLSLAILKPVDFTKLRLHSLEFFRVLFSQLFISTQVASPGIVLNEGVTKHHLESRDRTALEEVFVKATRIPVLTQGLLYFLTSALHDDGRLTDGVFAETLTWAGGVARDTLRTRMDVITSFP